ncbi:hypothetical protein POM88_028476 [Heracleum sosnowskyi]|uniref:Uncharacterized protein n=1 Tax=Heracleum sosnowskyi TaxID=360622 RepID=A0AAD8HU44_9APIA|nr:hypothetical protein POM88_028476 [Heracleum sosnowskyi]
MGVWRVISSIWYFIWCHLQGSKHLLLLKKFRGKNAPSPVGELGMVEMTQALELSDVCYEQISPDMLISGFLRPLPDLTPLVPSMDQTFAWDPYSVFSNFSHHSIHVPDKGDYITWLSVKHHYQAHKFMGMNDPERPDLARPDWENVKVKFSIYPHLNSILLSTSGVCSSRSFTSLSLSGWRPRRKRHVSRQLDQSFLAIFHPVVALHSTVQSERQK